MDNRSTVNRHGLRTYWNQPSQLFGESSASYQRDRESDVIVNDRTPVLSSFRRQLMYGSESGTVLQQSGHSLTSCGNLNRDERTQEVCSSSNESRPFLHGENSHETVLTSPKLLPIRSSRGTFPAANDRLSGSSDVRCWDYSPTGGVNVAQLNAPAKPRMIVKPNLEAGGSSNVVLPEASPGSSFSTFRRTSETNERRVDGLHAKDQMTAVTVSTAAAADTSRTRPTSILLRSMTGYRSSTPIPSEEADDELGHTVSSSGTFPWSSIRQRGKGRDSAAVAVSRRSLQQPQLRHGSVDLLDTVRVKTVANSEEEDAEEMQTKYSPRLFVARTLPLTTVYDADPTGNGCWTATSLTTMTPTPALVQLTTPAAVNRNASQCSCDLITATGNVDAAAVISANQNCSPVIGFAESKTESNAEEMSDIRRHQQQRKSHSQSYRSSKNHCGGSGGGETVFGRLAISGLVAVFVSLTVFCTAHYQYRLGLPASCGLSAAATSASGLLVAVSRRLRCLVVLAGPAAAVSSGGRVGILLLGFGCLLAGPVSDVAINVREMARSMTCSADVTHNHTILLLQPFDALLDRVHDTLAELDTAVADVERGLEVLDTGLWSIEQDVDNGRLQLYSTGKTCKMLIERAFNQCTVGIQSARDQCLGVIGALGTVYHHARHILDSINPDRWAPKQQMQQQQVLLSQKRRLLAAAAAGAKTGRIGGIGGFGGGGIGSTTTGDERNGGDQTVDLPDGDDSDICEPLSTTTVCQSLNDSQTLCQPSRWAGDAIQDAINATQSAMRSLRTSIHFRPLRERSKFPSTSFQRQSSTSRRRRNATTSFGERTSTSERRTTDRKDSATAGISSTFVNGLGSTDFYFRFALTAASQLMVAIGLLLVFRSAAIQLRRYRCSDTYANRYISASYFRSLGDRLRQQQQQQQPTDYPVVSLSAATVFPLHSHERQYVADVDSWDLSRFESQLNRRHLVGGATVCVINLLISGACLSFDLLVAVVLSTVVSHERRSTAGSFHGDDIISAAVFSGRDASTDNGARPGGGLFDELLSKMVDSWSDQQRVEPVTRRRTSTDLAADPAVCVPMPIRPSAVQAASILLPLCFLHLLLICGVLFRARILRMRHHVTGYYYPRRAHERAIYLYRLIESRRRRLPSLLRAIARNNDRRNWHAIISAAGAGIDAKTLEVPSNSSRCGSSGELRMRCLDCLGVCFGRSSSSWRMTFHRIFERCLVCDEFIGGSFGSDRSRSGARLAPPVWCRKPLPITLSAGMASYSYYQSSTAPAIYSSLATAGIGPLKVDGSEARHQQLCHGTFCSECWNDLGRVCPLCDDADFCYVPPHTSSVPVRMCTTHCGDLDGRCEFVPTTAHYDSDCGDYDDDDDGRNIDELRRHGTVRDVYL